jgi:outer membrane protein
MTTSFQISKRVPGVALVLGLLLLFSASAQAQTKIATVSLRKLFEGYYKTKVADQQLKDRVAEAEKNLKGMLDDYQKSTEEYKSLSAGAVDQAVSSEERERRKKSAEAKLLDLQEIEKQVRQYRQNNIQNLDDTKLRMREDVLRSIRERVVTKAKATGYNLVLDVSAESFNRTDVILFSTGLPDMTDEVLGELNANAPAALLNADKEEKKDGKK